MAPINLPDGSQVSEIVLPDGSTASEVLAPDGSTVFGSAIPDSALYRWKFDEGSGNTAADSINNQDATINGATWVSNNYQGGFALEGDGTNDDVDTGTWFDAFDEINGAGIAVTIEQSSISNAEGVWGLRDGGTPEIYRLIMDSDGTLEFRHRSDNTSSQIIKSDNGYADGNKHRVFIQRSGPESSDIELYVDGSSAPFTISSDQGPLDLTNNFSSTPFKFFDYLNSGFNHFSGILDDAIVYDSLLSAGEVTDDFDAQPWS